MVKAVEILKPKYFAIKAVLVGSIQLHELEKEIFNLIKKYNLNENIVFVGYTPFNEVCKIISQSDVGVCTLHPDANYVESLPIKIFEYMAAGIPVIASNFPLWKEIVEDNKCGLCVNPLSPEEIAQAIEYVIDNPKEARKMGENGRKAVE